MDEEKHLMMCMAGYQEGKREAFDDLYRVVRPKLFRFLIAKCLDRQLAEELLQETFLQIHKSRRTHMAGKPVTPWLFAIAHHVFLSDRRSRMKRNRRVESIEDHAGDFSVPSRVETDAEIDLVKRALAQLPPGQRESLLLHYDWGFNFREIGGILGIRAVTAKLRAYRGLKKLRTHLNTGDVTSNLAGANITMDDLES